MKGGKDGGVTKERADVTRTREGEGGLVEQGGRTGDQGAERERYLLMKQVMKETRATV